MNTKKLNVLIVDDEYTVRMLLQKALEVMNYCCLSAGSGAEALDLLKNRDFALMLLDINMPEQSGVEILREMGDIKEVLPVIMVTGYDAVDMVRLTMREGAYDYVMKPWNFEDLQFAVKRAIEYGQLAREKKRHERDLEMKIEERTREVQNAFSKIRETYKTTILALGSALETRDTETQSHCLRVAHYSWTIAKKMGIKNEETLQNIEWGAYLHDIGKIGVPDSILRKPSALTDEEWEVMKMHPEIGGRVIEGIDFLKGAVPVVRYHHERYDGKGYPYGLRGKEIPVEALIFSVADAMDAMLSDRPYRKGMPLEKAKRIMSEESGLQFSPDVVAALNKITDEELLSVPHTAVA